MPDLLPILKDWQELAGAALGGVISVLVALIVAYIPIRRDDLTAAMLVISNLVPARARHTTLVTLAARQEIAEDDFPLWLSEKLLQSRPKLTPTYDAAAMRVMAADAHIATHLAAFDLTLREMDEKLDRLAEDFLLKRSGQPPIRPVEAMKADARLLARELEQLAGHAYCAERLTTTLVLSRRRLWTRMRRRFRMSEEERQCLAKLR
jgi:hypothetical protein